MMEYKEEIDICINLINLIENTSVSNEDILNFIATNDYLGKAKIADEQKARHSLTQIIENIIHVLTNADKSLPIHNQRYSCSYLDIEKRLFYSCEKYNLPVQELIQYLSTAEYIILQSHFTEYIIGKLLPDDNIKLSEELIQKISDKSYHYHSYRLIADYYGRKGDKENFLKILKKCDARKDVWDIQWIKSNFIEAYSEKHTLEETFELVDKKEFGDEYLVPALNPHIKTKQFDEIKSIIKNPCFDKPNLYLKEIILGNAFGKNNANHTVENFNYLCDLLLQIPARVRYGNSDFSLKDNLWSLTAESLIDNNVQIFKNEINFCIKKVSSQILKNGIKKLMQSRMK